MVLFLLIYTPAGAKNQEGMEEKKAGYILLNDLVVTFENFDPYKPVEEWKSKVFNSLNTMLKQAECARAKKEIEKLCPARSIA